MRKLAALVTVFFAIGGSVCCTNASAAYSGGEGWFDIYEGLSGIPTITAESYSRVSAIDDYDIDAGSDVFAQTSVAQTAGSAHSSADSPYYLASMAVVKADAEAYSAAKTLSRASLHLAGMTAYQTGTAPVGVWANYQLNMPPASEGYVQFYIGLWEGSQSGVNLLLTPQGDWSTVNLGTESNPFCVLSAKYASGSNPQNLTNWSVNLTANHEYSFYTFVEAYSIPEPATLLLLGLGGMAIRVKNRKRKTKSC